MKQHNVFDALEEDGHDENFEPVAPDENFLPTNAPPGTKDKIDALAERVRQGLPLWHSGDRNDISALDPRTH